MRDTTFIYALCEQGTKTIRYFGKADRPADRRKTHIRAAENGEQWPVSYWIRKRLKIGQRPDVHVLCEVPQADFTRFEMAFIALGRQHGMRLLNATDGGEGMTGFKYAPESCAKMSAAGKGRKQAPRSPEHCAAISAAKKGKKLSPQACVNMSAAQKGKKMPPRSAAWCANISAGKKGKGRTPGQCANISAGKKGKYQKNTSGFLGVIQDKNKWLARIGSKYIGRFSKIEDAIFARNLMVANLL